MRKRLLILTLLAATFARESAAQDVRSSVIYTSQHQMLVDTIKHGAAYGVMTGDTAELFRKQFKSDGILTVSSTTLQEIAGQPDCKRVKVIYTKKEVITPAGPRDLGMEMKLNYCVSGRPPVGGEDMK
jgi:hypothetical protein